MAVSELNLNFVDADVRTSVADGAGAAADGCVEAAPPPQKKARRDEAGGSD